ncbi:hypothetical protein [Phaffia rhodozyma]|uniref:Uncharacterized protein n=1 Tax=Phaffia rhodozyma TaxID=264483 RepID=A0A0F7SRP0_PHARH|nr:hypothetical protein [Phaffia rhodozyma]
MFCVFSNKSDHHLEPFSPLCLRVKQKESTLGNRSTFIQQYSLFLSRPRSLHFLSSVGPYPTATSMGFFHRTSDSGSSSVALSRSSTDSYASTADTSDTSYQGSASVSPNTPLPKSSSSSSLRAFFASPKQFIFPPPAVFYPASTTTTDHMSYRSRGTSFDRQHSSGQVTPNGSAGLERKTSRRKQRSQSFHVLTPSSSQTWLSPDGSTRSRSDFLLEIACNTEKVPLVSSTSSRRNSFVLMSACHSTNSQRDSSVDSLGSSVSRRRTRSIEYAAAAGTPTASTSAAGTPIGTPQSINMKQLSPLQEFRRSNSATRPFPLRSNTAPPVSPTQLSKIPTSNQPVSFIDALAESARERPDRADGPNDENERDEEDDEDDDDRSTMKPNQELQPRLKIGSSTSSSSAGFRADSPSGRSLQGRRPIGNRGYTTTSVSTSTSSPNATTSMIYIDRVIRTTRHPIPSCQKSTRTSTVHSVPFPSTASSKNLALSSSREQFNQLEIRNIPLITTSPPSVLTGSTVTFKPKSRRTLSLPFQPHLALSIIEPAEPNEADVVTPTATTFPPTSTSGAAAAAAAASAALSPSSSTSTITPRPRTHSTFSRPLTTSLKGVLPEVAPSQIPSSASMACLSTFSSWDFPPARAESLAAKHKVLSPLESYVFPTTSRSSTMSSSNSLMLPPPVPPPRSIRRSIVGGQPTALVERALNSKATTARPNVKSYSAVPTIPLASSSTAPTLTSTTIAQTSSSSSSTTSLSSTALSLAALTGPSRTTLKRSMTVNSIVHIQGPSQLSPPTVPSRHPNRAKLRNPQSYSLQNCKTISVQTNTGSSRSHSSPNSASSSTALSSSPVYMFPLESSNGSDHSSKRSLSPSLNGYVSDSGHNHHRHLHEMGFGSISTPAGWADRRGSHSSSSSLRQEVFPFEKSRPLDSSHTAFSPISSERSSAGQSAANYNFNVHRPGIGDRRQTTGGPGPSVRQMERTLSIDSESSSSGFSSFAIGNYDPSVNMTAIDPGMETGLSTGGTSGATGKTRSRSSLSLAGLLGGFTKRGSSFWDGASKKRDDDGDQIDEFGRQKVVHSFSDGGERNDGSSRRGRGRGRDEKREQERPGQEEDEDEDEEEFCSFGNM